MHELDTTPLPLKQGFNYCAVNKTRRSMHFAMILPDRKDGKNPKSDTVEGGSPGFPLAVDQKVIEEKKRPLLDVSR